MGHAGHRAASDLGAGVGVDLEAEADFGDAGGLPSHLASPSDHGRNARLAARARIVAEALALLDAPGLSELFAEGALAEVPVAGAIQLPDGTSRAISGRIDRLAVTPDSVIIADFKTTARPPERADSIPVGTLAQLAAYAALMRAIAHYVEERDR